MICIALAALGLAVTAVLAADGDSENESLRQAFDAVFPTGQPLCFVQTFDRAHLAAHREQTVRSITIGHRSAEIRNERAWDRDEERSRQQNPALQTTVARYLHVAAKFRRDRRRYDGTAVCGSLSDGRISCYTDGCDTANARLFIRADGARHILAWPGGFTLRGTCGDDSPSRALDPAEHDGPFRLARAPMSACRRK
jgi:hypothetical protein